MDNQKAERTKFQKFCDKSTYILIGLYVIWTALRLISAFSYLYGGHIVSLDDTSSFHIGGIFDLLLMILYYLVPAFSIFYLVICFWKEEGLRNKLLKAAVLPICFIAMAIVLFGTHAVLDTQKDNLGKEESFGNITYSVPNHWTLFEDNEWGKLYTDNLTAAWIDVETVEAESLEAAVNQKRADLSMQGYTEYREVKDIELDAPYSGYIYKTDKPQESTYWEFVIIQYPGKLYEFSMDVDEEDDLSVLQKVCESIQYQ